MYWQRGAAWAFLIFESTGNLLFMDVWHECMADAPSPVSKASKEKAAKIEEIQGGSVPTMEWDREGAAGRAGSGSGEGRAKSR